MYIYISIGMSLFVNYIILTYAFFFFYIYLNNHYTHTSMYTHLYIIQS